jgi:predicted NUDIX family phosphoesterase
MINAQKVLTVPSQGVSRLYQRRKFYADDLSEFWSCVANEGQFIDRSLAETTEDVKQLIACAVITNGQKILCARRARKGNREALALRWTIVFGGHVDDGDACSDDPIRNCVIREIEEELGIKTTEKPKILGLAVDPATRVGRLHLGVVFLVHADLEQVFLHNHLDSAEFANRRHSRILKFMDSKALLALQKAHRFDPWSELLVSNFLDGHAGRLNNLFQGEFDLVWDA